MKWGLLSGTRSFVVLLCTCAAALSIGGADASPIPPMPSLWVIAADGTDERELLSGSVDFDWAPDGKRLVVAEGSRLSIVDVVTGDRTTLTGSIEGAFEPEWSPDGSSIAYRYCADDGCGLAAISPDDGESRVLLPTGMYVSGLSWSPDSSRIAFVRGGVGVPGRLYVLEFESGSFRSVSSTPALYAATSWSHDGAWISFLEWKGDSSYGLSLARPDSTDERSLADVSFVSSFEWSPVAAELAFSGSVQFDEATYKGVFLANPSDTTPRLLVPDGSDPTWSPDGDELAFSYEGDLWVRPASGEGGRSLTSEDLRDDGGPDWSPGGEWIAFVGTQVQVLCGGLPYPAEANVIGTPGDDVLNGTPEADVIAGRGGNDTIHGLDGNDTICGDDGDDTIDGGPGADTVFGNRGADNVGGGLGDDTLEGGGGDDTIDGGEGSDIATFFSGSGGVHVDLELGTALGHGSDLLTGIENLTGSGRDDVLAGDGGPNALRGAGFFWTRARDRDTLVGRGGPDTLIGYSGADRLRGGSGRDRLRGGEGKDECHGGPGRDSLSSC